MAKSTTKFVCTECGAVYSRWQGQCKDCKEWNVISEFKEPNANQKNKITSALSQQKSWLSNKTKDVCYLSTVEENVEGNRISTGKSEFDRVLGGGIFEGSVILLSGSPGAGKSTLLIDVASYVSQNHESVLYVSCEESLPQVRNRANRLELQQDKIAMFTDNEINSIMGKIDELRPKLVIIDSLQALYNDSSDYAMGSASSLKENAFIIINYAKTTATSFLLIGHVNKDGNVAGPKILEHIVDGICNIENEESSEYRIIRTSKNRFGKIDEVGVFSMTEKGMISVDNPSEIFISQDRGNVCGTSILSTIEGNRPLLIEIQALVSDTEFNYPKRLTTGVELSRLNLLIAIMNKHSGIKLSDQDVYATVVGGLKVSDTAIDLPLAISIASAYTNKNISSDIASFGEIDLTGRLRPVSRAETRIKEAVLRGFKKIIIPKRNMPKNCSDFDIEIIGISKVDEVFQHLD